MLWVGRISYVCRRDISGEEDMKYKLLGLFIPWVLSVMACNLTGPEAEVAAPTLLDPPIVVTKATVYDNYQIPSATPGYFYTIPKVLLVDLLNVHASKTVSVVSITFHLVDIQGAPAGSDGSGELHGSYGTVQGDSQIPPGGAIIGIRWDISSTFPTAVMVDQASVTYVKFLDGSTWSSSP